MHLNAATLETDKRFDVVYSNKVLHHLSDAELAQSVERQHELLNANGVICHSFWAGEGSEEFKGMFVNYHNETAITKLLGQRFEVLYLERYQEFEASDSMLLIARKAD